VPAPASPSVRPVRLIVARLLEPGSNVARGAHAGLPAPPRGRHCWHRADRFSGFGLYLPRSLPTSSPRQWLDRVVTLPQLLGSGGVSPSSRVRSLSLARIAH
jgi:hypothetical protein